MLEHRRLQITNIDLVKYSKQRAKTLKSNPALEQKNVPQPTCCTNHIRTWARPTHEPRYRASTKISFIIAINLFMGVNEMHVKILLLLCRLRLVLRLGGAPGEVHHPVYFDLLALLCRLGLVLQLGSV